MGDPAELAAHADTGETGDAAFVDLGSDGNDCQAAGTSSALAPTRSTSMPPDPSRSPGVVCALRTPSVEGLVRVASNTRLGTDRSRS